MKGASAWWKCHQFDQNLGKISINQAHILYNIPIFMYMFVTQSQYVCVQRYNTHTYLNTAQRSCKHDFHQETLTKISMYSDTAPHNVWMVSYSYQH